MLQPGHKYAHVVIWAARVKSQAFREEKNKLIKVICSLAIYQNINLIYLVSESLTLTVTLTSITLHTKFKLRLQILSVLGLDAWWQYHAHTDQHPSPLWPMTGQWNYRTVSISCDQSHFWKQLYLEKKISKERETTRVIQHHAGLSNCICTVLTLNGIFKDLRDCMSWHLMIPPGGVTKTISNLIGLSRCCL